MLTKRDCLLWISSVHWALLLAAVPAAAADKSDMVARAGSLGRKSITLATLRPFRRCTPPMAAESHPIRKRYMAAKPFLPSSRPARIGALQRLRSSSLPPRAAAIWATARGRTRSPVRTAPILTMASG